MPQNVGADRIPAPTEAAHHQSLPAVKQRDIRSLADRPLAPQSSTGTPPTPNTSCVEGQSSLLSHVIMRDILRVLGDSRPHASFSAPSLYSSLQLEYLQDIPGSQAEQQGRLLVYLEWLTQRLFQHGSAEQHKRLYATVLEMCKASQVYQHVSASHALSPPESICPRIAKPVQLQSVLRTVAVCRLCVLCTQHANILYTKPGLTVSTL